MTNTKSIRILGLAGSVRDHSYNRSLLKSAEQLIPKGVVLDIYDLSSIPLYNQDAELAMPEAVSNLKNKIASSDAVLFACPEYNFSVPAILKNAIDWASRPYGKNSWANLPAAIVGASVGAFGTVRAQAHLRQILAAVDMEVINKPEVLINLARERFDGDSNLKDQTSRDLLRSLLEKLVLSVEQRRSAEVILP